MQEYVQNVLTLAKLDIILFNEGGDKMNFADKLKIVRKSNDLTQEEFAKALGVSRGNIANMEAGTSKPTQLLINCISMLYNIDKTWLMDNSNNSLSGLNSKKTKTELIEKKYSELNDEYKKFVEKTIENLLDMQNK